MKNFGIVVGRWYGVWSWLWYADILHESEREPYVSFNALTKRGALRKAQRYLRRIQQHDTPRFTYVYDETTHTCEKI